MVGIDSFLHEIKKSKAGGKIAALFDFDGTIIAGYSAMAILKEKFKRRELGAEEIVEYANLIALYGMGGISFSGLMTSAARFMKGVSEESYREFGEELYRKHIARLVYPETRAIIQAHQAKGHAVAIISSATIYQIAPTARDLDIEHILCSQYEVKNGEFTGGIVRPLCFGEGKVLAAEKLAAELGFNLDQSFFYSDSHDDIELLERVGRPQVLNPDRKLAAKAQERGWPVGSFTSRSKPTVASYLRSIYATGTLLGSFAAGLSFWALTGSRREATNFSIGMFGDLAAAIVGIELGVTGEANLSAARPCVIIFNHQSQADMIILTKLVRKDMGGVGKQEIRRIPILGQLMEHAGTVFVDRQNTENAIEAMRPLVDAIRKENKSICIAPEGTRGLSPRLNPFKKGAFHLAMQAGVPILPIVIHNAADVAPQNEFAMCPAKVRVDILPAVDTSDWNVATIDRHIAEVRNMFLRQLGQQEEPVPVIAPKPARKAQPGKRKAKPRTASKNPGATARVRS